MNDINTDILTDIDGNVYKTVKIGKQIWMAENLQVSHFRNGDPIPNIKKQKTWKGLQDKNEPAWCYYENKSKYRRIYGKLYNWYAVNDKRGIAPDGWHVATKNEWNQLYKFAGQNTGMAGIRLKSRHGWKRAIGGPYANGTDNYDFTALPGGGRSSDGEFNSINTVASWWSSTKVDFEMAVIYDLVGPSNNTESCEVYQNAGASVRCVKD